MGIPEFDDAQQVGFRGGMVDKITIDPRRDDWVSHVLGPFGAVLCEVIGVFRQSVENVVDKLHNHRRATETLGELLLLDVLNLFAYRFEDFRDSTPPSIDGLFGIADDEKRGSLRALGLLGYDRLCKGFENLPLVGRCVLKFVQEQVIDGAVHAMADALHLRQRTLIAGFLLFLEQRSHPLGESLGDIGKGHDPPGLFEFLERAMVLLEQTVGGFVLNFTDGQKFGLGFGQQGSQKIDQLRIDVCLVVDWLGI